MKVQICLEAENATEAVKLLESIRDYSTNTVPTTDATSKLATSEVIGTTEPEKVSDEILISDAVKKYAEENSVNWRVIEGTGAKGRINKGDIVAVIDSREPKPTSEPEMVESVEDDDPFNFDDPPPAPVYTKDDVREALVAYQVSVRDTMIAQGKDENDAKRDAINIARKFLVDVGGSETLGGLSEDRYAKIVTSAKALTG